MKFAEIGARIKALRLAKGLKQEDVAAALHTSRVNYTKMETGERDLKTEHCIALARFFGVSCDYILTGVEAQHLDIHEELGLSEWTIQLFAMSNENKKREKNISKFSNLELIDVINGLLSPKADLWNVLQMMYSYFYTDFEQPYDAPYETAERHRDGNLEAGAVFRVCDPLTGSDNWTILTVDKDIYKQAFLERFKREFAEKKDSYDVKRGNNLAQKDNP